MVENSEISLIKSIRLIEIDEVISVQVLQFLLQQSIEVGQQMLLLCKQSFQA